MRPTTPLLLLVLVTGTATATPLFVEKTTQLPQACTAGTDPGCYTNYAVLADLDGNGTLDVLFPNARGYYVKQQPAEPLQILKNGGAANFTDVSAAAVGGFTGWLREIAVGDIDGDGDLDIAAPDAWGGNAALFVNDGTGAFVDEAATRWNVQTRAGSVRFLDADGDGALDLIVGDWGADPRPANPSVSALHLWRNDGAGHFTAADARLPATAFSDGAKTPIDLDVLDANGDFALDILINTRNGNLQFWLNDGTGHFVDATANFPAKPGPYSYNPGVCDVDGDGDLDVWIDNGINAGDPQLAINDGTGHFRDETSARVVGAAGQDDNGVSCVDLDGDGDFDAVVYSLGDGLSATGNERALINDGTGHFTLSPDAFPLVGDSTLGMDFGDLNGDGRIDAVTGQGEGGDFTNRLYLGTNGLPADTRAPVFRAVETGPATVSTSAMPVVRFAIEDGATTEVGPRLSSVYVEWTGAAGAQNVEARFSGGDLFRATLPARGSGGNVTWRACADDFAGNHACGPSRSYLANGSGEMPKGSHKGCACDLGGERRASWIAVAIAGIALLAIRGSARARRTPASPRRSR